MEAEEGECTAKVTQKQIEDMVNVQTCNNSFDLQLAMGSYRCGYSRNGSTLMLASSMGHTCLINWRDKEPILDINLR
jgi:U3 small nucleolar RNA-associated protein 7